MSYALVRYFLSLGNVAISMFIGALMFAYCALYQPGFLDGVFSYAAALRDWFLSLVKNQQMRLVLRPVVHESSIVLMFFTIVSRVIVGAVIAFAAWVWRVLRAQ